jgi:glyoxylase-like metal-dependent hydrolase (beta-lactamase superfamily II)
MFCRGLLYGLAGMALFPGISAHPSHANERRDLVNVFYGPDSDNINFLPLPNGTYAPPVDPKTGYYLEHLGSGSYFVTEGAYQALFLVSTTGVILVDCPPTIGYNLKAAIKSVTDKPVTHFVYSHAHGDHVSGAYIFKDTVREYIAHQDTRNFLEELPTPDPHRPLPNRVFRHEKLLRVGNQTLELSYKGPNHQAGNIFIYAPSAKTLMLVDVIFPGWVPFSGLAQSENIPNWIKAHDQILEYDFTKYIGGHVGAYGTRKDVVLQKEYITDLYHNCVAALTGPADGNQTLGPVVATNPGNPWAIFKVVLKRGVDECAEKTNRKWNGRLAAVDVFGWENAYKMLESLRIDFGVLGPAAGRE